ncbi:MAG: response regulator [Verrucomicrobia bacterium]|nr:response regulator [Verrucomicrobiota bacterium]
MKILLVDDDPTSLEILKAMLITTGHQVTTASDGLEAWTLLGAKHFQVIVSDWMMPKLDGLELCRRVRARHGKSYIYFILLTARTGRENHHLAMDHGVDDFLAKPLRQDELSIRLRVAERILTFMSEVGELKRLLPICSYCKRIRDDSDYWQQIESYIHDQTGADFTHGICPECLEKYVKPQIAALQTDRSDDSSPRVEAVATGL